MSYRCFPVYKRSVSQHTTSSVSFRSRKSPYRLSAPPPEHQCINNNPHYGMSYAHTILSKTLAALGIVSPLEEKLPFRRDPSKRKGPKPQLLPEWGMSGHLLVNMPPSHPASSSSNRGNRLWGGGLEKTRVLSTHQAGLEPW